MNPRDATPAMHDNTHRVIEVSDGDLPLRCPLPRHTDWNSHPRVYLEITGHGEALCPYCGTLYRLKGKPVACPH